MPVSIRIARESDAAALLAIYAPYVCHTAITFEYDVPSLAEFTQRIHTTLERFPYLVALRDDEIVGYAYASPLKSRAAYAWAVETSIYVRTDRKRGGVGRLLYDALEAMLAMQGVTNLNACIATPQIEDEYLTRDSVAFHARLGYRMIGEFYQCGYKFKRWYNMVWMEKILGEYRDNQPPVCPFPTVKNTDQ